MASKLGILTDWPLKPLGSFKDGVIITMLLHAGPVEFLYYWLHRALHHHYLYSSYHSHHPSSIVTEPITSVIHPFAKHIAYYALFSIPVLTTMLTGTGSMISFAGYVTYVDSMNNIWGIARTHSQLSLLYFPPSQVPHVHSIVSPLS
ncbi:hypothetical protein F383_25066 [Gossypium arboreum]|uniref:Fatty acid hydroxylase domain-containing protein n=1 Tax=Gossypium arboreum TaxID=29729 RepID=A0A0B0P7W6_GOSAR|nr:hypothetical protein F383_25066 [Gossypium arboreum]